MVTQLKFNPHWTELLGQSLGQLGSGALEGYQQGREQQSLMQQQQQQRKAQEDYLIAQGIDPAILDQPTNIQNQILKGLSKSPGWGQLIGGYFGGGTQRPGMMTPQQQQQRQLQQFSPETQAALQLLQPEEEPFSPLRAATSSAVGGGSSAALGYLSQVHPLLAAGTLGSLATGGVNKLGQLLGAQGNIVPEWEQIQDRFANVLDTNALIQQAQNLTDQDIARYTGKSLEEVQQKIPRIQVSKPILKPFPTFSQITEAARDVGESVGLPTKPKNAAERKLNKLAEVGGFLANPATWSNFSVGAKDIAKSLGAAFGADAAGYLTKELTGSELLGNVVDGGLLMLYSMFPGTLRNMGAQRYNQVQNVANEAETAGLKVNMEPFQQEFRNIVNKIDKHYTYGSPEYNYLAQEANRLGSEIFNQQGVNPNLLLNETRSMSGRYSNVPEQAQKTFQELIELQRKALGTTLDSYKTGTSKLLTEANDLWRKHHIASDEIRGLSSDITPRKLGIGTLALYAGLWKPFLAGAAGYGGLKYVQQMMKSPAVRSTVNQIAKANAVNNAGIVDKLSKKLNKQGEQILKTLPKEEQEAVRNYLKQIQSIG